MTLKELVEQSDKLVNIFLKLKAEIPNKTERVFYPVFNQGFIEDKRTIRLRNLGHRFLDAGGNLAIALSSFSQLYELGKTDFDKETIDRVKKSASYLKKYLCILSSSDAIRDAEFYGIDKKLDKKLEKIRNLADKNYKTLSNNTPIETYIDLLGIRVKNI